MPVLRPALFVLLLLGAPVAMAHANGTSEFKACKALAATLAPKQADITELTASRDETAIIVEASGEAWEDAEILRNASAAHAAKADQTKSAYEDAKKQLARKEMALQATVRQYNDDVSAFNNQCAKK